GVFLFLRWSPRLSLPVLLPLVRHFASETTTAKSQSRSRLRNLRRKSPRRFFSFSKLILTGASSREKSFARQIRGQRSEWKSKFQPTSTSRVFKTWPMQDARL